MKPTPQPERRFSPLPASPALAALPRPAAAPAGFVMGNRTFLRAWAARRAARRLGAAMPLRQPLIGTG